MRDGTAKKLVAWACLGAGTVILTWTIFTMGSPRWLPVSISAWMRRKPLPRTPPVPCLPLAMRQRLASELASLSRDILAHADEDPHNSKWSAQLNLITSVLDPRMDQEDLRPPSLVCPEDFDSTTFSELKCNSAPPLAQVLSVILPARGWDEDRVSRVVHGLGKKHGLTVILLLGKDDPEPPRSEKLLVLRQNQSLSSGALLNEAVSWVKTSHVLVGHGLVHFSWDFSPLTRLLRVIDRLPAVGVAAGAYRDESGRWNHGCLQRSITNYHATFIRGYQYSGQECMYCDDVLGPFLAPASLLRRPSFGNTLDGPLLYRDWFTRLGQEGFLYLVCPDVMFFVETEPVMTREDWKAYATMWVLQGVSGFDNKEYDFSCTEVHINCANLRNKIDYYLIPPCCSDILMNGMAITNGFAEVTGVEYEMHHGSLLGAVKLGSYLPWDFDHDIYFDCRDKRAWKAMGTYLKRTKSGCSLRFSSSKVPYVIQCRTYFIDMVCRKPLSRHTLPDVYRNVSTWVEYGGYRVPVMANPGAAARDQAGPNNLRHAQHWRVPDHPDAGAWRACQNPFKQACLDRHPADGSLAFSYPPRCLP
ncbi:uncharacterized protein [Penaeus vannamei]|uniref:LicD/FKTN/FKRP nucleotidyltransferase domain-containing protein n=1 Tax=Penaeus vannamei TaxID=6689 RepID=A0A3R7MA81_PENVA|nr:uncharacterized protein LOC113804723 [Penaeus vannamei]ROT77174.1 hypothetical protein C7M84_004203 [Penaeus vannamei]